MDITLSHTGQEVPDFPRLVAAYDETELRSPLRSTVPLLAYWRDTRDALARFTRVLGVESNGHTRLSFEHPVPVRRGRGKASHTDLMLAFDGKAVAVEAKSTEPPHRTVANWLAAANANNTNRKDVLSGWLDLISGIAGRTLTQNEVGDCSYQLIHRTASACAMEGKRRMVVYHCFDATDRMLGYYLEQLDRLRHLTGDAGALEFWLIRTRLERSAQYAELVSAWTRDRTSATSGVRRGLIDGSLLSVKHETATRV